MPLQPGSRLGPYEIVSALGAGGMGEVYRARDTGLKREVAIKVLPEDFAQDPDRLARFQREAELLATLNHPNIAAIYGVVADPSEAGHSAGALVLELVEGPTLADRIASGPLPVEEALAIARQIADALDAAHERGVIHRDLKPANIKVRPDGAVKVLDFGLAKALEPAIVSGPVSLSPTITSPAMTRAGVVLGTAAYMSPEQARGRATDKRSDVWAFGCVLFEMLTATRVFDTGEMPDTIAAVLRGDPDWTKLGPQVPERITTLLRRCLEKDHTRRLRDIGDARLDLDARSESVAAGPVTPAGRRQERFAWSAVVAVLSLIAVGLTAWALRPTSPAAEARFDIAAPDVSDPADLSALSVSPDGLSIAFVAAFDGQPHVWVRSLDSVTPRALPGTAGASLPFWSGDSRSVGFYADDSLKRIDLAGGLVKTLAKALYGFGGAWNRDGAILLVQSPGSPILRTTSDGATPVAVTMLDGKQTGHSHPHFLPDGVHFLYFVEGTPDVRGVYVGALDGSMRRKLFDADSAAVYASGHLLFIRNSMLFAHAFDLSRLAPTGVPFLVADAVTVTQLAGVSAAADGTLVFRTGSASLQRQFVWVDRSGKELETIGRPDSENLYPTASPDRGHLAFFSRVNGNVDVWLLDTRRNLQSRFTDHVATDLFPVWSRDGHRIAFASDRNGGGFGLYQRSATGGGGEELLLGTSEAGFPSDWSPGDKLLMYARDGDLWAMPMIGNERKPFPVSRTESEEREGKFSPDGRWLAYVSNSSGRFEVYIQPFPGSGPGILVSTTGGAQVQWRPDGRELFYIALDGKLMAVPIDESLNGQSMTPGAPRPLFATHVGRVIGPGSYAPQYVVSADGQRFLMSAFVHAGSPASIRVIVNWAPRR
jgi:serine/threonine protein kinase